MVRCTSPKCVKRGNKCFRPNGWLEWLARHKPRKRAEHSAAYRQAKLDGLISPERSCVWHTQRKRGLTRFGRDLLAANVRGRARRLFGVPRERLVTNLQARRPQAGPVSKRASDAVELTARGYMMKSTWLGMGTYGYVYLGHDTGGHTVAVKLQRLREGRMRNTQLIDVPTFEREVRMQQIFSTTAGIRAPHVLDWYTTTDGKYAMTVMEPIDGILNDLLKRHMQDRPFLMYVARQLKRLVNNLAAHGLVHGDLHFSNLAYILTDTHGRIEPQIALIDFGRSHANVTGWQLQNDTFWVWRSTYWLMNDNMNRALRDVGFPGSERMRKATGSATPSHTQLVRYWRNVKAESSYLTGAQEHELS